MVPFFKTPWKWETHPLGIFPAALHISVQSNTAAKTKGKAELCHQLRACVTRTKPSAGARGSYFHEAAGADPACAGWGPAFRQPRYGGRSQRPPINAPRSAWCKGPEGGPCRNACQRLMPRRFNEQKVKPLRRAIIIRHVRQQGK